MPNYDGENELRIFYTTLPTGMPALEHVMTIDVKVDGSVLPGDDFATIGCEAHNGTFLTLGDVTDGLVDVLIPFLSTGSEISRAELWHAEEASDDFTFISAYSIASAGTGSASAAAAQYTFTFRSLGGGIMRVQIMEPGGGGNDRNSWPWPGAAATLGNLIISTSQPWLARDNTRPVAGNKYSQTQNEALYRKRFRL